MGIVKSKKERLVGEKVEVPFLGRAAILALRDLPVEVVEVPEWGTRVRVRSMTALERDRLESEIVKSNGKNVQTNMVNIRAKMVATTVVDEEGALLFGFADLEALGGKSARAIDRIFEVASRLAGMRKEDVEELAGNFLGTPEGG